jgi:hypothetical protein
LRNGRDGPGHDAINVDLVEIAALKATARDAEKKTTKGMTS